MEKIKCTASKMCKNPEYIMVDIATDEGFIVCLPIKITDQALFTIGQELNVPKVCFGNRLDDL